MKQNLCWMAIALWLVGVAVLGWFFMKGTTTPGSDGRTEIALAPAERDLILAEMRQLLKAVQGVVTAVNEEDAKGAETAARAVGMAMTTDVEPAIMLKLPLAFKQMGMSVHRDFDAIAEGVAHGKAGGPETLQRLSSIMSRCTTCHDLYRLSVR